MHQSDPIENKTYTMDELVVGLKQMRDQLVHISTLIKDFKANIDWQHQGQETQRALDLLEKLSQQHKD